jgi:hypothetical protein
MTDGNTRAEKRRTGGNRGNSRLMKSPARMANIPAAPDADAGQAETLHRPAMF